MKILSSICVIILFFLTSCNSVRDSAGVNRKVIDEYSIIENPPLIIPPNFDLLPPDQIASKTVDDAEEELAQEILFGLENDKNNTSDQSSVIQEIIKELNIDKIDKNIREDINAEFSGEKSTINDEIIFANEDELNEAIEKTNKKNDGSKKDKNKKKKKKRFFFF